MMISLNKGLELILESAHTLNTEKADISNALHRVLAEDVFTDTDIPSFEKSAMDGFAIRAQDIYEELEVLEFTPAGKAPSKTVGSNQCIRIMTGAMVPQGANMVIMIEHTKELTNGKIQFTGKSSKSNILKQGEDMKKGALVLSAGSKLNAAHIGILASVGKVNPLVYQLCNVGVIATGSELVSPYKQVQTPQIRNSNSYQIHALCKQTGALATNHGLVTDDPKAIKEALQHLMINHQVVVFTGGASFGDHDFSAQVLQELGADIKFHLLAIQPGKPVLFATLGNHYLFGLSGNPVSSSVQFELLVKPLLRKLMGLKKGVQTFKLPIDKNMTRKKSERDLFFPVIYSETMEVIPLEYHGSAHLNAYESADAMACFPQGFNELKKGDLVDVRPL